MANLPYIETKYEMREPIEPMVLGSDSVPVTDASTALSNTGAESTEVAALILIHRMLDRMYQTLAHIDDVLTYIEQVHLERDSDTGKGVPKASDLVQEYYGNEDMDGDGEIFGKDFYIDLNDPDCPPLLQKATDVPQEGTKLSWQQYLIRLEQSQATG